MVEFSAQWLTSSDTDFQWTVDRRVRIGFFATKKVAVGEELVFDYQLELYGFVYSSDCQECLHSFRLQKAFSMCTMLCLIHYMLLRLTGSVESVK